MFNWLSGLFNAVAQVFSPPVLIAGFLVSVLTSGGGGPSSPANSGPDFNPPPPSISTLSYAPAASITDPIPVSTDPGVKVGVADGLKVVSRLKNSKQEQANVWTGTASTFTPPGKDPAPVGWEWKQQGGSYQLVEKKSAAQLTLDKIKERIAQNEKVAAYRVDLARYDGERQKAEDAWNSFRGGLIEAFRSKGMAVPPGLIGLKYQEHSSKQIVDACAGKPLQEAISWLEAHGYATGSSNTLISVPSASEPPSSTTVSFPSDSGSDRGNPELRSRYDTKKTPHPWMRGDVVSREDAPWGW